MESQKNTGETPVFGISMVLAAIAFIILLNQLPFPQNYGFWNLAGVFMACCAIGGVVFAFATAVVNALFKVIIEIMVVMLLLFNVSYVAFCWVFFDNIILEMDLSVQNNLIPIALLIAVLLVIDLLSVIVLLPFARVANSSVLDN